MKSQRFPRTTEAAVVLRGDLFNRIMETLERLDALTLAPPLYFLRDGPTGRCIAVNISPGVSLFRCKVKDVTDIYTGKKMSVVKWDGTTESGAQFEVRAKWGHAVDDEVFAMKSGNGTDVADVDWLEIDLYDPKQNSRYQVVQLADTVGRPTINSALIEG